MKLATTTADFFPFGLNVEQSIDAVTEAGFRYIDYSFSYDYRTKTGLLGEDPKAFAEKLLKMSEKSGFKFVQSHSPLGRPFAADAEGFIEATKQSIETASWLGIPNIVVHSGYLKGLSKEETFKRNKAFYEELLKTAEKCNINILTENFDKMENGDCYWIDCAEDLKELVEYIDHPLLKACWDIGHGNMQELPQHEALALLKPYVAALHIQGNFGLSDDHIMPFMGTINMESVMNGLIDIGFDGYFTFEADGMLNTWRRRKYDKDTRLATYPVEFAKRFESIKYDMGRYVLEQYDCFSE